MSKDKTEKQYLHKLDKIHETSRQNIPVKKGSGFERKHVLWGLFITFVSFSLSISILFASTSIFKAAHPAFAFVVVLLIIMIGVFFDAVGVAVTAAEETPFHSMASKKIRGAKQSLVLLRNADRVSSFCNDVVGDICSVVSGSAGAAIVYRLFSQHGSISVIEAVSGALIAALTVGGKAFAKNIGMSNSNYIVYRVGVVVSYLSLKKRKRLKV